MAYTTHTTPRQRQRRLRREARNSTLVRVAEIIGQTIAMTVIGFFIAWVLINWATGCGETWITYTGERIAGECVLMPWRD